MGSRWAARQPWPIAAARENISTLVAASPMWERAKQKVLVVDDSADFAAAMVDVLTDAGHDAAACEGGSLEEVLEQVLAEAVDVIILDLGLSFDGRTVVEALALAPERPAIVVCTGADEQALGSLRPHVQAVLQRRLRSQTRARSCTRRTSGSARTGRVVAQVEVR